MEYAPLRLDIRLGPLFKRGGQIVKNWVKKAVQSLNGEARTGCGLIFTSVH